MNDMASLVRSVDGYNRTTRLYPALLTLAPVVMTVALTMPDVISASVVKVVASVVVAFGGAYLLASLARSRGKVQEEVLLKRWGAWPTTILLRHSDDTIDPETKTRYHHMLEAMTGKKVPTKAEELTDAKDCDHRYRAATTQLIEARRGAKYKLLHNENASYGFRRNLLGLKPIGIIACLSAMLIAVIAWQIGVDDHGRISPTLSGWDQPVPVNLMTAFVLDFIFALLWFSLVTQSYVRQAANEYALALFRSLDDVTLTPQATDHSLAHAPSSETRMRLMLISYLRNSRASTHAKAHPTTSNPRIRRPNVARP